MAKTPIAWLENELPTWVENGFVSEENSKNLLQKYKNEQSNSVNISITGLYVFASLLIGLGIISIFAYNFDIIIEIWGNSGRAMKALFSLFVLLIGQGLCFYAKKYKPQSLAWSEASTVFWFISLGGALSIIGQVYELGGTVIDFIKYWILFSLPIMYLFNARTVAFLLLIMITTLKISIISTNSAQAYFVWILFILWLPYYIEKLKNQTNAVSTAFLNWIFIICMAAIMYVEMIDAAFQFEVAVLIQTLFYSCFWVLGITLYSKNEKIWKRSYESLGKAGVFLSLLFFTKSDLFFGMFYSLERGILPPLYNFLFVLLSILSSILFVYKNKERYYEWLLVAAPLVVLAYLSLSSTNDYLLATFFVNIVLIFGSLTMFFGGVKTASLGLSNQGLSLIAILTLIHFLSSNFPLLLKGFLFIGVGIGFLVLNKIVIKKIRGTK